MAKVQQYEPWLYIEGSTIESDAWKKLPGAALKILLRFRFIVRGPLCDSAGNIPPKGRTDNHIRIGYKTLARRTGLSAQSCRDNENHWKTWALLTLLKPDA